MPGLTRIVKDYRQGTVDLHRLNKPTLLNIAKYYLDLKLKGMSGMKKGALVDKIKEQLEGGTTGEVAGEPPTEESGATEGNIEV